jgi:hypothetical protein
VRLNNFFGELTLVVVAAKVAIHPPRGDCKKKQCSRSG